MPDNITGTVYWHATGERVKDAVIAATSTTVQSTVTPVLTDDDGDFGLTLPAGHWSLAVHHRDGIAEMQEIDVDTAPQKLDIKIRAYSEHDDRAGNIFFFGTIIALVLVLGLYVILHNSFPPVQESLDSTMVTLITTMREQLKDDATAPSAITTGSVLVSRLNTLAQNESLSREDRADIADRSRRLETTLSSDDLSSLDGQLIELEQLLNSIAPPRSYYWHEVPGRFLEILLVALAGILVNKIITAGTFLRWKRFYRAGIYMHLAHIVAVPILSIVTVGLLSLASFQLTLADNNTVTIDLSNPETLVIISFLVSVNPWPLWGFIQSTAERVLGRSITGQP